MAIEIISSKNPSIAVVGSVNLDIVAKVKQFPQPGETVTNAVVSRFPGGKGANQALAARRLGADVQLVACLGNDPVADEALANLMAAGVDLSYCQRLDGASTGLALILVSEDGENQIVVAPGANAAFNPERLKLPACDAVIAQLEVPLDTILKAAQMGERFFCLNAAPAKPVPAQVLEHVDLVVVNEIEALTMGHSLDDYQGLLATTYGSRGAQLSQVGEVIARATPPRIEVVDTTGAGDAFTAALTVGLVSGLPPGEALQQACVAGALTTTQMGAQSSPTAPLPVMEV